MLVFIFVNQTLGIDGDFAAFRPDLGCRSDRVRHAVVGLLCDVSLFHLLLWPRGDGDLSRFMQWGSLARGNTSDADAEPRLSRWPIATPPDWTLRVSVPGKGGVALRPQRSTLYHGPQPKAHGLATGTRVDAPTTRPRQQEPNNGT